MKKKYYYDCPIQALYMYKEFGVKFYLDDGEGTTHPFITNDDEIEISDSQYLEMCEGYDKIYIEIISEHIFEPKEGDIGICDKLLILVKFDIKDWVPSKMLKKETYYEIKETLFVKTVYRNGKHFFMPKEEN